MTFDLKGSSDGRTVLSEEDIKICQMEKIEEVIKKNTKNVLKDNDFTTLNMKLKLNKKDAAHLINWTNYDSEFLKGNHITDYSLLITIHRYSDGDYERNKDNYRVMKSFDNVYLYNFSIIDFFCVNYVINYLGLWYS